MYRYEDIGFRAIDEADLEKLRVFHNESETMLFLGRAEIFSSLEQLQWWKTMSCSTTNRTYCIVKNLHTHVIGALRTNNIDHINKNCEIGIDLLPEFRGKGEGHKSYRMGLEYLFDHLGMHMVYLRYIAFNERAGNLYEKLGFVRTGLFPEYIFRYGKFWDYILMSMTLERYKALYKHE
jgi:RimJ/RimL family protein N-acetyltransferase